jgi:hypothetical protein
MAVYQLQIERYFAPDIRQRGRHGRKRASPRQSARTTRKSVARACPGQVCEQLARAIIADAQAINVEHGIAQSGPNQAITNIMHIREAMDVSAAVYTGPRARNFSQAVGPEGGKSENAARNQHTGNFLKYRLRFRCPGQQLVGDHHVESGVRERQVMSVALDKRCT